MSYLQFRLNVMRTRVAQDDYAWPSADDIGLKIAWLDEEIKGRERKAEKAESAAQEQLDDEKFREEVTAQRLREEAAQLQQDRALALEAQKVADDVV